MIRILFGVLLVVHGLLHLPGFVQAFQPGKMTRLSVNISRPAGLLWLGASLLFLLSGCLLLLKMDAWWMPATAAVLLSQILIFGAWKDAKAGSVANLIALIGIILGYGAWQFDRMIKDELSSFLPQSLPSATILTLDRTAALPPIVRTWLLRSNAVGQPVAHTLHLDQKGAMRSTPDGKWMPVDAEQFFTVDQPGFFWMADVTMMPGVHLAGRDKYQAGRGDMLVKALSLFPVADTRGPETDQGAMLRYLAETCWFPSGALSDFISWEQTDSLGAKATIRYGGAEASGTFHFSPEGDILGFDAMRYYDRKSGATLEKWHIENDPASFREFEGIRIPTKSEVTWKLDTGDFTWYRLEITDVRYNVQKI